METVTNCQEADRNRPSLLASEIYNIETLEAQAWQLIKLHDRIEHDRWDGESQINARTALFEELTAKGHLSRVEYDCDAATANRQTLLRLLNGWSNRLPAWEQERRFYEIVEELIVQQVWADIKLGLLPPDTMIGTLSDYAESAPPGEAHKIGYRFLNRKGMVRGTHFECNSQGYWRRVIEQISRSNSNDQSSSRFIQEWGSYTADVSDSTQRLKNQILISRRQFRNGVVDVQRELDAYAGPNIRYGEDITKVWPPLPDYDELRKASYHREKQVERFINRLAEFENELNARYHTGQITYEQKLADLYEERTKIVNEICLLDPSYAKDARGELSAKYFERAAASMAAGDHTSGQQHFECALRSADPRAAAVCGGVGVSATKAGLSAEGKQMYISALNERKNWKWQRGFCVVGKGCNNRWEYVEVGPCGVCRSCQAAFDDKKPKVPLDLFDLLSQYMARINQELWQKKTAKKQKQRIIDFERKRRAKVATKSGYYQKPA